MRPSSKTCRKCGNPFKGSIVVDGRRRSLHKRAYCYDCSPFGKRNRRILEKHTSSEKWCPLCKRFKALDQFYQGKSKLSVYCVDCTAVEHRIRQIKFKQQCVDYKGGSCADCGYSECLAALDFHHLNDKKFNLSEVSFASFDDRIISELDKCDLLCANCHRQRHVREFAQGKEVLQDFLNSNPHIKYL